MARSTYFDLGRGADACPGSESGYAQRFQCGNVVKRLIWTGMKQFGLDVGKQREAGFAPYSAIPVSGPLFGSSLIRDTTR
jgi:hypothetical protein